MAAMTVEKRILSYGKRSEGEVGRGRPWMECKEKKC